MQIEPDIAGFEEAQARLSTKLGIEIVFRTPVPAAYPPGTPMNDDGEPLDPTIEPTSGGGYTDTVVRCGWARGAVGEEAPEVATAVGNMDTGKGVAILTIAQHAQVQWATEAIVFGRDYQITEFKMDGLVHEDRWLAYMEES